MNQNRRWAKRGEKKGFDDRVVTHPAHSPDVNVNNPAKRRRARQLQLVRNTTDRTREGGEALGKVSIRNICAPGKCEVLPDNKCCVG